MSVKVKMLSNARFFWINKCVHCGCQSDRSDTVNRPHYKFKGYYLLFISYTQQLLEISYPVCLKHKIFAKTCRFIYWLLFLPVIVLGLMLLLTPLAGEAFNINVAIAFIIVLIIFELSIFLQPLRIVKANDNEIVLKFRNEKIANEFIINNRLQQQANDEIK